MLEKYTSILTALIRIKWTNDRDYKSVEIIMSEAILFISKIMN